MIRIEPFRPFHVELIEARGVQVGQRLEFAHVDRPPGMALSAFAGDQILMCGGIIPLLPRRGDCWAVFAEGCGPYMREIHYATRRFIGIGNWRRLEAQVLAGFGPACRWVKLLGFKFEGAMPGFGLNGETYLRYARVTL